MSDKDIEISDEMPETPEGSSERNSQWPARECQANMTTKEEIQKPSLIEAVLECQNMILAYKQVVKNKGSAGIDKMQVEDLKDYLKKYWRQIKSDLLAGTYKPKPVKQVEIPKPGGGVRKLGIPTVIDRLVQQALHQVLNPIFDPGFSESSHGFRPGRGAHRAVLKAKEYIVAFQKKVDKKILAF
jgi:RNA-directed DNA polymerase